jgi:hypothetical protein
MVGFFIALIGLLGLFLTIATRAVPWRSLPWQRFRAIRRKDEPELWWIATAIYACAAFGGLAYGLVGLLTR